LNNHGSTSPLLNDEVVDADLSSDLSAEGIPLGNRMILRTSELQGKFFRQKSNLNMKYDA
jgi:hypothetical protein